MCVYLCIFVYVYVCVSVRVVELLHVCEHLLKV